MWRFLGSSVKYGPCGTEIWPLSPQVTRGPDVPDETDEDEI